MASVMKTTLMIDDAVLRQAKQHAAAKDTTVSELVNQSLRAYLHPRVGASGGDHPFVMPVYRPAQERACSVSPAELAALRDEGR